MCGIAGQIVWGEGAGVAPAVLARLSAAMRERGPDDEGFLLAGRQGVEPAAGPDSLPALRALLPQVDTLGEQRASLGLVHRRLSIIDISEGGHQPMTAGAGRYWLVFNGEIYNYRELRRDLESLGVAFRSQSDTEVLLAALVQWGDAALPRLNGMFAFAFYDREANSLLLARDRIGIKPLYCADTANGFLFASSIRALLASGEVPAAIDFEGLWHNLTFGIAPRPRTCFRGIVALRPGHTLRIDLATGRRQESEFWFPHFVTDTALADPAAASEALHDAVTNAIRRQLVADVEVATFMSGGVDSTTVSAIASRHHAGIRAFTLGFGAGLPGFDEVAEARATAAMNPMQHVVCEVSAHDYVGDIERMVLAAEEPNPSLPPNYVIARLVAEQGVKVVLNGLGGDELFYGYGYYPRIRQWQQLRWAQPVLPLLAQLAPRPGWAHWLRAMQAANPTQFFAYAHQRMGEADKRLLLAQAPAVESSLDVLSTAYGRPELDELSPLQRLSYLDLMHYLGNHHLNRIDQFSMAFSLEGRVPLLDNEVIDLALRMPDSVKLRGGVGKFPLRQVASRYIHPSCLDMKKKGFALPAGKWLREEWRELAESALQLLACQQWVSPKGLATLRERHFVQLVTLGLWLRAFDLADA
ncbi:MAG: asparagine synthase [Moraxellaceae bacterium]|jgi:asparagine synthase (glutamine-hydrolysing)|nr:asparagine synthase [Moraxellaceae bacterium]